LTNKEVAAFFQVSQRLGLRLRKVDLLRTVSEVKLIGCGNILGTMGFWPAQSGYMVIFTDKECTERRSGF
jgi:hypothetical protein